MIYIISGVIIIIGIFIFLTITTSKRYIKFLEKENIEKTGLKLDMKQLNELYQKGVVIINDEPIIIPEIYSKKNKAYADSLKEKMKNE